jgi:hypothetical protein
VHCDRRPHRVDGHFWLTRAQTCAWKPR